MFMDISFLLQTGEYRQLGENERVALHDRMEWQDLAVTIDEGSEFIGQPVGVLPANEPPKNGQRRVWRKTRV